MRRVVVLCLACLTSVLLLKTSTALALNNQAPVIDGIINEGEYPRHILEPSTNIDVYWYNDETNLYVGLRSPGLGWVAIAFEPNGSLHQGANIIIGYVKDGKLSIDDQYGATSTSHVSDVTLGSTNNILESAGTESAGRTTIEFKIPLNSGDPFDIVLEPDMNYTALVAYQATADDLTSMHTAAGIITMKTIPELSATLILQLCLGLSIVAVVLRRRHVSKE